MFARLGRAFARLGLFASGPASGPPVEGEGGDSLLLFNSGGVTLLHLGMI